MTLPAGAPSDDIIPDAPALFLTHAHLGVARSLQCSSSAHLTRDRIRVGTVARCAIPSATSESRSPLGPARSLVDESSHDIGAQLVAGAVREQQRGRWRGGYCFAACKMRMTG